MSEVASREVSEAMPGKAEGDLTAAAGADVLDTPFIAVESSGRTIGVSLPELYALLSQADSEVTLLGLRAHQQPVVECWLAMVAAHALDLAGVQFASYGASRWREMLAALTSPADASFWRLVEPDVRRPAFMQPAIDRVPSPFEGEPVFACDEFDTLVTSKNHDVKTGTFGAARAEHWFYALICLQTSSSYLGRGHYGVMRINGGYGSRVFCALYPDNTLAARWATDTRRLLAYWNALETESLPFSPRGERLLACRPWNLATSISPGSLHPGVVEVCRAVRLVDCGGRLGALAAPTTAARIAGLEELKGLVGDPWTPSKSGKEGQSAFSPSGSGLSLRDLHNIVFQDNGVERPPFASQLHGSARATLLVRCLARGQGGTNGYHEYAVPVPPKAAARLFAASGSPEQEQVARLYRAVLEAGTRTAGALRSALEEAFGDRQSIQHLASATAARFSDGWRQQLMPFVIACIDEGADTEQSVERWSARLAQQAREFIAQAVATHGQSTGATFTATAAALRTFETGLRHR